MGMGPLHSRAAAVLHSCIPTIDALAGPAASEWQTLRRNMPVICQAYANVTLVLPVTTSQCSEPSVYFPTQFLVQFAICYATVCEQAQILGVA